ncbi:MAG TPA: hypothetical protein VFD49_11815 [Candidatus Dormibacteraeota bacterium]|nr:hypothetical protein [Candidatus Dormibacteraeota bacterium]
MVDDHSGIAADAAGRHDPAWLRASYPGIAGGHGIGVALRHQGGRPG